LPNGQAGASRLTFRTETSGSLNYMSAFPGVPSSLTSNAYFQPGTYFGE